MVGRDEDFFQMLERTIRYWKTLLHPRELLAHFLNTTRCFPYLSASSTVFFRKNIDSICSQVGHVEKKRSLIKSSRSVCCAHSVVSFHGDNFHKTLISIICHTQQRRWRREIRERRTFVRRITIRDGFPIQKLRVLSLSFVSQSSIHDGREKKDC